MKLFAKYLLGSIALLALPALADGKGGDVEFRDPFWPVGYSPAKEEPPKPKTVETAKPVVKETKPEQPPPPPEPEPDWPAAMRLLRISGYAESGGQRSCVINGRTVSEAEKISIVHNGFRYTWRIDRIAPLKSQMRFQRLSVTRLAQ